MTAPGQTLPVGPTGQQLQVELQAAELVTRALRQQLVQASQQITRLYIRYAGSTTAPLPFLYRQVFADSASQVIAQVQVDIRDDLWVMVLRALRAGQLSAQPFITAGGQARDLATFYRDQVYGAVQQTVQQPRNTGEWLAFAVAAAQARVQAGLLSAQARPQIGLPPDSYASAMSLLDPAREAMNNLERDVRWATNAAFNQAVRELADAAGHSRMWIAERDACLHCLAYSGEIAAAGRPYPAGLTYYIDPSGNPKPLKPYPVGSHVWGPPLHPNCRCFQRPTPVLAGYPVQPWETGPYHPAQALKREAARVVLRGAAGNDSLPARLRATDALLARGSSLPKSVKERAARAVRRGRYGR